MDPLSVTESLTFLMYKFGPPIVIVSSFLVLFIVILSYMLRQQQASNAKIMNEHQQLLQYLIDKNDKDNKKEDTKDLIKIYTKVISNLNRVVMEYSNIISPIRVSIYLLHNGSHGITKFPFLKFSCVGETIRNSFFNHINNNIEYPVNMLSNFFETLANNNSVIKIGNDQCFRDSIINKLIVNINNNYVIKSILSSDSIMIGFILIEFDPNVFSNETKANILKKIDMLANNISLILDFSDFNFIYKERVGDNT